MPEVSANPAAVTVIQGTGPTLAFQATGKFLSYQWRKNGANLSGETNASLVLNNVNASEDDANYSVVISNDWGKVITPLTRVIVATALPTITLNGSAIFFHEAATPYTDAGATAVDALGGDLTSAISITSADINVTSVSQQVVIYSVTDAGGNANTSTRTVTVQDTTNPVITLTGDSNFTHNLNTAWVDPGYDANDTLDGNLTSSVSISGAVDVNTTGTYILNYSVSDIAGNQADINRTVLVSPMGPWIFTNAGATGRLGPTQAQVDANYSGTTLEGLVTINSTHQGIQEWSVPATGTYRIEANGGQGGTYANYIGGKGSKMIGSFILNASDLLKIAVGQKGSVEGHGGGGGGGTFITKGNIALVVAGGGGGAHYNQSSIAKDAPTTLSGLANTSTGTGHKSGSGGGFSSDGENGVGGSGIPTGGGLGWTNGLVGGLSTSTGTYWSKGDGGFGGGGAGGWPGGSGGGYFGGVSADSGGNATPGGSSGGSFNSGTNQDNQAGLNEGHGKVIITYIGN